MRARIAFARHPVRLRVSWFVPGAECAALLDVEILRRRLKLSDQTLQLACVLQHDLGATGICLDPAVNVDLLALERAQVADVAQILLKDDDGERTLPIVLAEIEEVGALLALRYLEDFACNASIASDVVLRL